ncbi:LptF/LptG family permease, partial [Candidatus Fermentibacterales bacterium]|nr:LptF/LptG family permease [Candidatus Fermentibacterales bacterium]
MKKLQAYTIREFFPPFVLAISVFTFVMLLDKLLDLLELIVSRGVPVRTVAEVFLLLLPSMVAVVVPMGVLAGVIMAIGRMTGDLEITAMKASGVSIFMPMVPLMVLSVAIAGLLVVFNNHVLPDANHMAKNLMLDIGRVRPTSTIVPGMFVEDIENHRILVGSKDDLTGELHNVIVHENVPAGGRRTILALSGRMEPVSANRMRLSLFDGEMHEAGDGTSYRRVEFDQYTLELTRDSELVRRDRESRGDREMSAAQMRSLVDSLGRQVDSLRSELILTGSFDLLAITGEEAARELEGGGVVQDTTDEARARINRTRNHISSRAAELRLLVDRIDSAGRSIDKFGVEIQKKYSIPFACMIFVLLGVPLGLTARRGNAG